MLHGGSETRRERRATGRGGIGGSGLRRVLRHLKPGLVSEFLVWDYLSPFIPGSTTGVLTHEGIRGKKRGKKNLINSRLSDFFRGENIFV